MQRVEPGTVFGSLPFRIGETYSDEKGAAAIRALFSLGLFKDVRIDISGDVVVVVVEERPTVSDITFSGVKEFDNEVLRKALRCRADRRPALRQSAGRQGRAGVEEAIPEPEHVCGSSGDHCHPTERNRVNLNFSAVEGDVAKIREIRVVGSKAFLKAHSRTCLTSIPAAG